MRSLPRVLALAVALLTVVGLMSGIHPMASAQDGTPTAGGRARTVPYVDADGNELARLTVEQVADPFKEAPGGAKPASGDRYVLVTLAVENTGDAALTLELSSFLLRDQDGFLYGPDSDLQTGLRGAAATPVAGAGPRSGGAPLIEGKLAVGDDRSGAIGFSAPESAELTEVLWVPAAGRLIVLDELGAAGRTGASRLGAQDAGSTREAGAARVTATPRVVNQTERTSTPAATSTPSATSEPTTAPPTTAPEPTEVPTVDSDGDGLTDADEAAVGTDPTLPDTDGDGVGDAAEVAAGTSPLAADTDGDGLGDADEIAAGTDPFTVDSDGDGLTDGEEVVRGSDPLDPSSPGSATEAATGVPEPTAAATVGPTETAGGADADGDGLSDAREKDLGTNPSAADTDGDGLPDGDEINVYGTNALVADSDGDGRSDGDEVSRNTNPLDAASS